MNLRNSSISHLVAGLMGLSFLFLAYSAYVVPMQLSFWANRDPCDPYPTLIFDLIVDTYFLVLSHFTQRILACWCVLHLADYQLCEYQCRCLSDVDCGFRLISDNEWQIEIILNFFIGFYESGCYEDSLGSIARRYMSTITLFWFDISTSIPLSYVDLYYSKVSDLIYITPGLISKASQEVDFFLSKFFEL